MALVSECLQPAAAYRALIDLVLDCTRYQSFIHQDSCLLAVSSHHGALVVGGGGALLSSITWQCHLHGLEIREDLEQELVRNHRHRRIIDQRSNHRHRRDRLLDR